MILLHKDLKRERERERESERVHKNASVALTLWWQDLLLYATLFLLGFCCLLVAIAEERCVGFVVARLVDVAHDGKVVTNKLVERDWLVDVEFEGRQSRVDIDFRDAHNVAQACEFLPTHIAVLGVGWITQSLVDLLSVSISDHCMQEANRIISCARTRARERGWRECE
jgi:hypothetical protein